MHLFNDGFRRLKLFCAVVDSNIVQYFGVLVVLRQSACRKNSLECKKMLGIHLEYI